jgi:outer membrane protein, heavy metal efflux system
VQGFHRVGIMPSHYVCRLFLLLAIAGCASHPYQAKPLNAERLATDFSERSVTDAGLREYMIAHGHPETEWPIKNWGLKQLSLLAFYFHPDLDLARSRTAAARAALESEGKRAPIGASARVEHHADSAAGQDSPWSLGFEIEVPLFAGPRREALVERQTLLAQRAQLNVGAVAWQVRSRLRDALFDLYSAGGLLELAQQEAMESEVLEGLLQRRLREGVISGGELTAARLRSAQANAEVESQRLAADVALTNLSRALGLPLAMVRSLALNLTELATPAPAPDPETLRREALLNRMDIRMELLNYAAAETTVKLEVIGQNPQWKWSPGYLWDQGSSVWSLALGWVLPDGARRAAHIREAEANREVAAKEFQRLQAQVIADAETAAALYVRALDGLNAVQKRNTLASKRLAENRRLFDAGYADRVDLVHSRLEALGAKKQFRVAQRLALDALGKAEDAAQIPLYAGPIPRFEKGGAK